MTALTFQLDGARLVRLDRERDLVLAWFGGHGTYCYNNDGREVDHWTTGNFAFDYATLDEVNESMERHLNQ